MADILILGVNGYSGRVTARYLLEHPQRNTFKLALAARSHEKVKATGLALDDSVRIWAVDVTDEQSVEAAVRQVAVVINCVGPYWTSGTNVVKACAKHGKHYVDLTGETPYIFEIIRLYDLLAVQNHSIIIPACGFDSAPSDIVVYLANKTLKSRHSNAEIEDSVTAVDGSGRVAGGTLRTVLAMIEEVPSSIQRFCLRPYALSPIHGGPAHPPFRLLHNLPAPMSYIRGGIHPMSLVNRAVVERTFGLQQYLLTTSSLTSARDPKLAYGPRFRYSEFWIQRNIFSSLLLSISIAVAGLSLMFLPPVRWLLKLFSPKSGNGPSESSEKKGFLEMINVTTATTSAEQKPLRVRTTIHGKASPLYLSSVMVAEAALALLAPNELPALAREGGVLTPMSGLGDTLVTRLQRTNMFSFSSEFVDEKEESAKRK